MDGIGLQDQAALEEEAFELYRSKYMRENPPPRRGSAGNIGTMFYLTLVVTLAAIVLSGMRTGDAFYDAGLLEGGPPYALTLFAAAMISVEGGLVVYAARKASKGGGSFEGSEDVAIMVGFIIAIVAGIGQSIGLLEGVSVIDVNTLRDVISIVVMFGLGVGAPVLAYVGGDVLGSIIAEINEKQIEINNEHRERVEDYMDSLRRSWRNSTERKLVRSDLKDARRALEQMRSSAAGGPNYGNLPENSGNLPEDLPNDFPVGAGDWRLVEHDLTLEHLEWLSTARDRDIERAVGLSTPRSARNWRQRAREALDGRS